MGLSPWHQGWCSSTSGTSQMPKQDAGGRGRMAIPSHCTVNTASSWSLRRKTPKCCPWFLHLHHLLGFSQVLLLPLPLMVLAGKLLREQDHVSGKQQYQQSHLSPPHNPNSQLLLEQLPKPRT